MGVKLRLHIDIHKSPNGEEQANFKTLLENDGANKEQIVIACSVESTDLL